jgi:hypothetical protein
LAEPVSPPGGRLSVQSPDPAPVNVIELVEPPRVIWLCAVAVDNAVVKTPNTDRARSIFLIVGSLLDPDFEEVESSN